MGRMGGLIIVKSVELLLIVVLWETYQHATCLWDVWQIFCDLPKLSQIGTITCLVIITTILGRTLSTLTELAVQGARKVWSLIGRIVSLIGRRP